jgi:EmrB/QacA subfamily drug resistance transporter
MQRKWRVTAVVCTGMFMSSLDLFIVNIAFPSIRRDFGGASVTSLSWILSAYAIVFAALLVPAGRWADAYGRKRVFLAGLAVFVAASAGCAAAPSVGALTAARAVQAIGGAFMMPTSLGLMLPEFEPRERAAAIGIWAAAGGLAAASGPPLGGLLVQLDWRLVFLVNIPVGLIGLAFGRRLLREHREPGAPRPDVLGAAGFTIAVAALVLAIVEGQTWGWASGRTLVLLAVVPAVLIAIWRRSVHHASPVVDPEMLRVRSFALALVGSILFYAGFGAMLLGGVLFLTGVWHEGALTAGLMLAPGPVLAATFSVVSSRLAGRVGFRALGVFGTLLVSAAAIWWILRIGNAPSYPTTYLPGMLLTGTGVGFTIPILTGAGVSSLAPERFATGVAVITMGRQVGSALGVAILVAVLATGASTAADFHHAWLIVLCGALGAAAALALLGPASKRAPTGTLATELS